MHITSLVVKQSRAAFFVDSVLAQLSESVLPELRDLKIVLWDATPGELGRMVKARAGGAVASCSSITIEKATMRQEVDRVEVLAVVGSDVL